MESRVSWEGGKRPHVSIQGLQEVVSKGTTPSVTVKNSAAPVSPVLSSCVLLLELTLVLLYFVILFLCFNVCVLRVRNLHTNMEIYW